MTKRKNYMIKIPCCILGIMLCATGIQAKTNFQLGQAGATPTLSTGCLPQALQKTTAEKPLAFIENKGQITDQYGNARKDINYKLPGKGLNIFVGNGRLHYQWIAPTTSPTDQAEALQSYRMDMELLGANKNAKSSTSLPMPYTEYYSNPAYGTGTLAAHTYSKITYSEVYPGIDWIIYIKDGNLEYDFKVHPGGKVADIKLKYSGATDLQTQADGSLTISNPMGTVSESAPYSYVQSAKGSAATKVASSFKLDGDQISFAVAPHKGILTIDPVLEWATYYGGTKTEDGYAVTTDNKGNVYMTGYSLSPSNIATTGSFQDYFTVGALNPTDAYLVKFNSAGERQWATYYGGAGSEFGAALVCDHDNNIYLAGSTSSQDGIATANGHQNALSGGSDAFLAKFNEKGERLWATYYGGNQIPTGVYSNSDIGYGLVCDDSSNVFLVGETNSLNNIATPGSFQSDLAGSSDAFIVKFDSSGTRKWATYFGGPKFDQGRSVLLDKNNNIYLGGSAQSLTGIATAGAFQTTLGGNGDAVIARFSPDGILQWATYYGGKDYDGGADISMDEESNLYLTGNLGNTSTGFSTTGSHQPVAGGNGDGFLAKFDTTGNRIWGTYFGGSNIDAVTSLYNDGAGFIYLAGQTKSINGIATPGTYKDTIIPNFYDGFLVKFNLAGERQWGTYFGASNDDYLKGIAGDKKGNIYLCGQTSTNAVKIKLATPGSHQDTAGGVTDALLINFWECVHVITPDTLLGPDSICLGSTVTYTIPEVTGAASYTWTLPSGWSGSSTNTSITVTPTEAGIISVVANGYCDTSTAVSLDVQLLIQPVFITVNENVLGTTNSNTYKSWQWYMDGILINGATDSVLTVNKNGLYSVVVTGSGDCKDSTSYTVTNQQTAIGDIEGEQAAISLYPNPATKQVIIRSSAAVHIVLSSMAGKILQTDFLDHKVKELNVSGLPAGMYLLQIKDQQGRLLKTEKLVKQ